ncbi:MAG: TetR/AcrR family transcriptional regulator [Kofleriaceae bacterium]|nr:TetR/AcrR family transcriptional regulator [Kofleriaceae bacterium]
MSQMKRRPAPGAVKNRVELRRRPTSVPPHRRVRLENSQRRQQLLQLGRTAFAERAYDEVSIDDIARTAEISKGLLYHYFPTKRDLYLAGLRATAEELTLHVRSCTFGAVAKLPAALDAYVAHAKLHAGWYTALLRGGIGSDPEVATLAQQTRQILLDAATLDPAYAPSNTSPEMARLILRGWVGLVETVTLDWVAGNEVTALALREWLIEMLRLAVTSANRTM